jgi:hypothetical protein
MVRPYRSGMALPRVKTTYSLPVESIAALDRLATRWGVSRSEALARAIAASEAVAPATDALTALDAWQAEAALDAARAEAWVHDVRDERRGRPETFARHAGRVAARPRA